MGFVFISIIIVIGIFTMLSKVGKTSLSITYAPGDADIVIDGKKIKRNRCTEDVCVKKVNVKKGIQNISLNMVNFNTDTKRINTNETNEVVLISTPSNPAGEKYYKDNEYVQQQIQNASSAEFDIGSKNISQKYPFIDKLNIYGGGYTIGYGASSYSKRDPDSVAIYIEASEPEYREKAIEAIVSELGVSPADIEIIYNNFYNPFKEQVQ